MTLIVMIQGAGYATKVESSSNSHPPKSDGASGFAGLLEAPLCLEAWLTLLVPAEEAPFAAWVVSRIVAIFYFLPGVFGSHRRVTILRKFRGHCSQL